MASLGKLTLSGSLNPNNPVTAGAWTITFSRSQTPRIHFEVWHAAIKGPANSTFQVFLDDTFFDNVVRGDINSFDPAQPMIVGPDTDILFHWSVATGTAPTGTLFFREVLF